MPPLPVIANTFRVTWGFLAYNGVTPRIVQHFETASANVPEIGEAIWDSIVTGLFSPMDANFEPQHLEILPLDGVTATVIVPRPAPTLATALCQGGGDFIPASAAVLSFRTAQRGPSGRGRSYIGPIGEANQDDGRLVGDVLDDLVLAWNQFHIALAAQDPAIAQVVASYTDGEARNITSISLATLVGTQRRRQNQLR